MKDIDLKALLKRVVELVMPDLRSYYRVVRKAKVVKSYSSAGKYFADVQPLRNDDSADDTEPLISKVEIPIIWGGPQRGIVCPPMPGTYCDLEYYDGDPNYPRISNFRWHDMKAPDVAIGGLIIQRGPGTAIEIDAANNIVHVTPAGMFNSVGGDKTEDVGGDWTMVVAGNANISASASATIQAPQINLIGNVSSVGVGGGVGSSSEKSNKTHEGSYTLTGSATFNGDLEVNGNIHATGTIIDDGGNTPNHPGH